MTIESATIRPKPAAPIPIMIGGAASNDRMLERIATRSDGWFPIVGPGQFGETTRTWERIKDRAASRGWDADRMELIVVGNVTFTDGREGADRVPFITNASVHRASKQARNSDVRKDPIITARCAPPVLATVEAAVAAARQYEAAIEPGAAAREREQAKPLEDGAAFVKARTRPWIDWERTASEEHMLRPMRTPPPRRSPSPRRMRSPRTSPSGSRTASSS